MSNWKTTAEMFESLIEKPKMLEKYLAKPPFKYIFDIISETCKKTSFAQGLYEGDELKPDYYGEKTRKINYLTKIISLVESMEGKKSSANPQKIVAGLEPDHTNELLQSIYKCATSGKSSDPYVAKVLGGGAQQPAEVPKPEKKKIQRPPSAAKNKKPELGSQQASKKQLQKPEQQKPAPKQQEASKQPSIKDMGKKNQDQKYSKKVKELMQEGQEQNRKEKEREAVQEQQEQQKGNIEMGRLKKKNKKGAETNKIISGTGELNEKELELVKGIIQGICQNTAPLGKSIEFINDDIESMNRELQHWRKQYLASKNKMQNELKITEETLLPTYDKLAEIEEQIKDQRAKIQTAKAQIIKNDSTIKDLLMSVVATK